MAAIPYRAGMIGIILVAWTSVSASAASASASANPDTLLTYRFGVLYRNRIELRRSSEIFPWNDPESETHISDRLSTTASVEYLEHIGLFLKVVTGGREQEASAYRERFFLEQGHIMLAVPDLGVRCRLFLRERIYRSSLRLTPVIIADSPFTSSRGEGVSLNLSLGRRVRARYVESILREDPSLDDYGGLPSFGGGGDTYRYLDAGFRVFRGLDLGVLASQVRSTVYGDAVMLASRLGIDFSGLNFTMELARSLMGDWGDIRDNRLLDLEPEAFTLEHPSEVFGRETAFSLELNGLIIGSPNLGSLQIVPGYRFCGEDFMSPAGGTEKGIVESYLSAWWMHAGRDLLVSFEARDRISLLSCCEEMIFDGSIRMRFRGGFETKQGFIHREGCNPSLVTSVRDENPSYRVFASARLDGAGEENSFTFLAEGALNLTGSVSVGSTLYLYRSGESFYHVGFEFRPAGRFLFKGGFGSFMPFDEKISMFRDFMLEAPLYDRMIIVSTRIWFGDI
jgi:hypothetical protein